MRCILRDVEPLSNQLSIRVFPNYRTRHGSVSLGHINAPMRPKHTPSRGPMSRDRTAAMLRRLRDLTREIRMLKSSINTASEDESRPLLRKPR